MKAVMAMKIGKLGMGDIPMPKPGEYEALVRMEACAICNSTDHKLLMNEFCPGIFPIVLGHEVVGRVTEIGKKVKNFKPGDRVFRQRLADAHVPGGRSCWGGFAEYGLVSDEWAKQGKPYGPDAVPHDQQKLLMDVEPALATGMVTLMETLDCIATCGAGPGKSVAIVGTGPVAQAFAMFAHLLGARPVYAFGRRADAKARFESISHVDGFVAGPEFPAEVAGIVKKGGFDLVMEAVGAQEAFETCLKLQGAKGRINVYGIAPQSKPYQIDQKKVKNVTWNGATEGRAQAKLVEYIKAGQVRLEDWVSHRFPMADYQKAFDMVEQKKARKAVLLP